MSLDNSRSVWVVIPSIAALLRTSLRARLTVTNLHFFQLIPFLEGSEVGQRLPFRKTSGQSLSCPHRHGRNSGGRVDRVIILCYHCATGTGQISAICCRVPLN